MSENPQNPAPKSPKNPEIEGRESSICRERERKQRGDRRSEAWERGKGGGTSSRKRSRRVFIVESQER